MIYEKLELPDIFANLTESEIGVLWCVIQGITNKEIGERLYISLGTVKFHLSSLYKKTQTRTRTALTNKVLLFLINRPLNFELFSEIFSKKTDKNL